MQKIADANELESELRRLLAYAQTERPSRSRMASDLQTLSARLSRYAAEFEAGKFDSVLNGLHAILDAISDGLAGHGDRANQESSALKAARDDLQKATALVLKAQKRF
jgi:molecular chaperone GrpE (heat shock protein)